MREAHYAHQLETKDMGWNAAGAISFVLSRETDEGGFSFAETTPRTVDDTYHALLTLELLGYDYRSCKTARYVRGIELDRYSPPNIVWKIFYLSHLLGTDGGSHMARLVASRLSSPSTLSFEGLYFLLSSLPYVSPAPPVDHALHRRISSLSIAELRTMDHVLMQLLLMYELGISFDRSMYAEWVRSAQNGDGGFGFFRGTTSFLENTYCALRALAPLESKPVHLERCRTFVQGCQISHGGFGKQSVTVPRVGSTDHGVASLLVLERMSTQDHLVDCPDPHA